MLEAINEFAIEKKKPFFGICVGMQLLADNSEENGHHKGFGWIGGTIKKLPSIKLKMPHMGWNSIKLLDGNFNIKPLETDYYFVHSYYIDCKNNTNIISETNYGITFPSIINKENIYGTQFHPENTSDQGWYLLKKFIEL
jgi:glutamine amidotransferase